MSELSKGSYVGTLDFPTSVGIGALAVLEILPPSLLSFEGIEQAFQTAYVECRFDGNGRPQTSQMAT